MRFFASAEFFITVLSMVRQNIFKCLTFKVFYIWTSLAVRWLKLHVHASIAGGPGSIPGQGTRSHMPQLKPSAAKRINVLKNILHKTL